MTREQLKPVYWEAAENSPNLLLVSHHSEFILKLQTFLVKIDVGTKLLVGNRNRNDTVGTSSVNQHYVCMTNKKTQVYNCEIHLLEGTTLQENNPQ